MAGHFGHAMSASQIRGYQAEIKDGDIKPPHHKGKKSAHLAALQNLQHKQHGKGN